MTKTRTLNRVLTAVAAVGLAAATTLGGLLLWQWHTIAGMEQTLVHDPDGTLIICGGGVVPDDACTSFVQLAGGSHARLVVIPCYEPTSQDIARLMDSWRVRGVGSVIVLHAASRQQSNDPQFVRPLLQATGVWLSGGQQTLLSERYVDTEVERQLQAVLGRGGVIGGSSAGAAAMTRVMISSGMNEAVEQRGFDLLPGVIVDQHFLYRNRIQRLLGMLSAHPGLVGLGIDERAAVMVQKKGRQWSVLGQSYAIVCLPQGEKFPRIEILKARDRTDIVMLKQQPGPYAISSPVVWDRILGPSSEK